MALVPIFRGLVNPEGELILRETERGKRQQWLRHLAGSSVEIVVRREPRQRTLDQSAYLHAVPFRLIADHTGDHIEVVKRNVMRELFGYVQDLETGLVRPWMEHTSSMTAEEATRLIEELPAWACDTFGGLEIPLPGEVEVAGAYV